MENKFINKKILILGLGINQGGLGATKFFAKAGAKVRVTDLKVAAELQVSLEQLKDYKDIEYTLGEHKYEDIDWADLIIRNPALKPDNQYLLYAQKQGKQVEMDMGIFLQFIKPEQIIGVTGTKGKSTTASLIYEVLNKAEQKIIFAGNIGKSVLDTIPFIQEDTLIILELSSFQLSAFDEHKVSPKFAVITNIYPDHINYHGSMENYIEAKKTIAKYQTKEDYLFLKKGDELTNNQKFLQDLQGQIIYVSKSDLPVIFSPKLPGEHNLENFSAVFALAKIFNIPEKLILETLQNFGGVEFRLQLIYDKNHIKIYNDTAATSPQATIEALQALPNSILISGAVNKNLPYDKLAQSIEKNTKAVFFLEGSATDEMFKLNPNLFRKTYNNLETLLSDVKKIVQAGDTILFSPGGSSFNLFQNEFDRGRKFNLAVEKIFR